MANTRFAQSGSSTGNPRPFHHVPGMLYRAAYTAETIAAAALATGTARSAEYRAGLLAVLKFKMHGERIHCPYQAGTASFDAYFAGNRHGFDVFEQIERVMQLLHSVLSSDDSIDEIRPGLAIVAQTVWAAAQYECNRRAAARVREWGQS